MSRPTYAERRATLIERAAATEGYDTPSLDHTLNIGRVAMLRTIGASGMVWPPGFYLDGGAGERDISARLAVRQRQDTAGLPK